MIIAIILWTFTATTMTLTSLTVDYQDCKKNNFPETISYGNKKCNVVKTFHKYDKGVK